MRTLQPPLRPTSPAIVAEPVRTKTPVDAQAQPDGVVTDDARAERYRARRMPITIFTRITAVTPTACEELPWDGIVEMLSHHAVRPAKDGQLFAPYRLAEGGHRCNEHAQ